MVHKRAVTFSRNRMLSGTSLKIATPHANEACGIAKYSPRSAEVNDDLVDGGHNSSGPQSSIQYVRSKKATIPSSNHIPPAQKQDRVSRIWHEDVRQLSNSLAKTCDEAFNRTSVVDTSITKSSRPGECRDVFDSPVSSFNQSGVLYEPAPVITPVQLPTRPQGDRTSWNARPLPPPPARTASIKLELAEARKQVQLRKQSGDASPGYLDRMSSHIDNLMQPGSSPARPSTDRRAVSAPVSARVHDTGRTLPSIDESKIEEMPWNYSPDFENFMQHERTIVAACHRIESAPEPLIAKKAQLYGLNDRATRRGGRVEEGVLVVPSSPSPAKPPAPLNIRKKPSTGPPFMTGVGDKSASKDPLPAFDLRQQYSDRSAKAVPSKLGSITESSHANGPSADNSTVGSIKTKANWFKRSSRSGDADQIKSLIEKNGIVLPRSEKVKHGNIDTLDGPPTKKSSFGFGKLFAKRNLKKGRDLETRGKHTSPLQFMPGKLSNINEEYEIYDDCASIAESIMEEQRQMHVGRKSSLDNPRTRQIEPQQNWLARLFHIKPATRFICFSVSKRRARQEIANLLKEWRKYGARDIVVDKERNIVFGRVGAQNCEYPGPCYTLLKYKWRD